MDDSRKKRKRKRPTKMEYIAVRVLPKEKEKFFAAADACDMFFSEWARDLLNKAADDVLRES